MNTSGQRLTSGAKSQRCDFGGFMARIEQRPEFLKALSHTEKKLIYISIERIIEEVICYDNFRAYYFTYEFYFKTQKVIIIFYQQNQSSLKL